jgi:hypothetical protein
MKKTRIATVYPMNRGLDRSSIPGTQNHASLRVAKNIIIGSTPSLKKRPGQRRIPYTGADDGTQAATHFFATTGNSQVQEVIRVRKGKVEALRDISGGGPTFVELKEDDGSGNLSDLTVSDTDAVTFERFGNALIIHFENTRPYRYTIGGNPIALEIISSHTSTPPTFSRRWDFSFWYSGRRAAPHVVYKAAPNSITDYTLRSGGGSFKINDGDGDPVGITALSPPFRGDMFMYKWMGVYQMYRGGYGYGWRQLSDEFGAVHHNCVAATPDDLVSIDVSGWHSLSRSSQMGGSESTSLTRDIYDYFQENVNWSATKDMVLVYDKISATLLLSYAKAGSSFPNAVLGMNIFTKQFFEWENVEYPSIGKYFDFGRQRTMVVDNDRGICLLDEKVNTLDGDPIEMEVETGLIFPTGNPKMAASFTHAWLLCRPTDKSVTVEIHYSFDGKVEVTRSVDTIGGGYGADIGDDILLDGDLIGSDVIGEVDDEMTTIPFECEGEGASVRFRITHTPTVSNPDLPVEIFGIVYEYELDEDTEEKVSA